MNYIIKYKNFIENISGAYYIIKKSIAINNLLNEDLVHSKGKDVEFTKRLHSKGIIIKCNYYSNVIFLNQKDSMHWEKEIEPFYLNKYKIFFILNMERLKIKYYNNLYDS